VTNRLGSYLDGPFAQGRHSPIQVPFGQVLCSVFNRTQTENGSSLVVVRATYCI